MTEAITRWLPSAWQDECIPEPQKSPDDFIFFDEEHGWHIRPVDADYCDPEDFTFLKLEAGQIVNFDANRVFGDFGLIVREDRSYEVDGEIPTEANCFRVDRDTDTLQTSLHDLVNGDGTAFSNDALEPGEYSIDAYWWSEKSQAFRFDISDGKGKFVSCAGAN